MYLIVFHCDGKTIQVAAADDAAAIVTYWSFLKYGSSIGSTSQDVDGNPVSPSVKIIDHIGQELHPNGWQLVAKNQ